MGGEMKSHPVDTTFLHDHTHKLMITDRSYPKGNKGVRSSSTLEPL